MNSDDSSVLSNNEGDDSIVYLSSDSNDEENDYKSENEETSCLVCKKNKDTYINIFSTVTSSSNKPVADVFSEIFIKRSMDELTFYNHSMCLRCLSLLNRADSLNSSINKQKKELGLIKKEFRTSLLQEIKSEKRKGNHSDHQNNKKRKSLDDSEKDSANPDKNFNDSILSRKNIRQNSRSSSIKELNRDAKIVFQCTVCGKEYNKKDSLRKHLFRGHDHLQHACSQCKLTFTNQGELEAHQQLHMNKKYEKNYAGLYDSCKIILDWGNCDFLKKFKMTKETFEAIYDVVKDDFECGGVAINAKCVLLITLWYLLNESSYSTVAKMFRLSQSICNKSILKMVDVLCKFASAYINWPSIEEAIDDAERFYNFNRFPGVVGVIQEGVFNCKNIATIRLLAVCNSNLKFIFTLATDAASSVNRSLVKNRFLQHFAKNKEKYIPAGNYHMIASPPFNVTQNVLVPFEKEEILTESHEKFNESLINTKAVVEEAFTLLKSRFKRLNYLPKSIENSSKIIIACCILHNFCLKYPNNEISLDRKNNPLNNFVFTNNSNPKDDKSIQDIDFEKVVKDTDGCAYRDKIMEIF